jgi:hypothetical protein
MKFNFPKMPIETSCSLGIPSTCGRGLRGGVTYSGDYTTLTLTLSHQGRGDYLEFSISISRNFLLEMAYYRQFPNLFYRISTEVP